MLYRKLYPFDYHEADTISEASEILGHQGSKAALMAGGVSLVDEMKRRLKTPKTLVSIQRIKKLRFLELMDDGMLRIGALATLTDAEKSTMLKTNFGPLWKSIKQIASVQVKNMGTIVGNISACNPASDVATALAALGAEAMISGKDGIRTVPVESVAIDVRKPGLEPDELITEIQVPSMNGSCGAFTNLARTKEDIAKVAVAVKAVVKNGLVKDIRLALGAVSPVVFLASDIHSILTGEKPSFKGIKAVAQAAANDKKVSPITDIRSTSEYRREMIIVLTDRALRTALSEYLNQGR